MAKKDEKRRESIAAELRGHRGKAGLTQKEVADAVGMEKTAIGKYEQGVSCMDYETAWDMADLYGISLDELGGRVLNAAGDAATGAA